MRKDTIEVRLSEEQLAGMLSVSKLAGVKPETAIKVILALFTLEERNKEQS